MALYYAFIRYETESKYDEVSFFAKLFEKMVPHHHTGRYLSASCTRSTFLIHFWQLNNVSSSFRIS